MGIREIWISANKVEVGSVEGVIMSRETCWPGSDEKQYRFRIRRKQTQN
jgi:hypothetical protein